MYTGATVLDEVIDPATSVVANPAYELQRASLALDDGRVIIGFGGNSGDCGQYHGLVVSAPENGSPPSTFVVAAAYNQGAVWMGGAAPAIDDAGDVWVATGNSSAPANSYDYSDGVVKLSPTMQVLDYFAPSTWHQDNSIDADLGSESPALLPERPGLPGRQVCTRPTSCTNRISATSAVRCFSTTNFCGADPDGGIRRSERHPLRAVRRRDACRHPDRHVGPRGELAHRQRGPRLAHRRRRPGLVHRQRQRDPLRPRPGTGARCQHFSLGSATTHFPSPAAADGLIVAPSADQLHAFVGPAGLPGPPTPAPTQPGLLVGGVRRRDLHVRWPPRSADRPGTAAGQAGRGHGRHPGPTGLLAGGLGRRHLRLR